MNVAPVPYGRLGRAALSSRWFDRLMQRRAANIVRMSALDEHLPENGLLLDLGSGLGHLAEVVLRRGQRRCIALDRVWSPPLPLAKRLRERLPGRLYALRAEATQLPFADACFDAIWCAFVLHHLRPTAQERVLAEVARVLAPGAVFVLLEDTPVNAATLRSDRRLNFERHDAPHHYRSPDGWRAVLRDHGLLPQSDRSFTGIFPRVTVRAVWHLAFVCRRAQRPRQDLPADGPPSR